MCNPIPLINLAEGLYSALQKLLGDFPPPWGSRSVGRGLKLHRPRCRSEAQTSRSLLAALPGIIPGWMYTYMHINTCRCMCVSIFLHLHMHILIQMHILIHMHCVHVHIHVRARRPIHVHTDPHIACEKQAIRAPPACVTWLKRVCSAIYNHAFCLFASRCLLLSRKCSLEPETVLLQSSARALLPNAR